MARRSSPIHRRQPLVFFGFDLLHLNGGDMRRRPLADRRARLRELLDGCGPILRFSESFDGEGSTFFAAAGRMGLEGIVSRRPDSRYASGRTERWLKTKCFEEGAFILLGTELKKSGPQAAHLARLEGGKLAYAGKAMISLTAADRTLLAERMAALAIDKPACPELRRERGARWVKPELVVGLKHLKGTGGLRHATLRAIYTGTPADAVRLSPHNAGEQSEPRRKTIGPGTAQSRQAPGTTDRRIS